MSTDAPIENRSMRRRRLSRSGSMVGLSMLATTGLLGAYLGNPRLARSYAAALSCGTASDTASLNTAITVFNTQSISGCDTITVTGNFTIGASGVTSITGSTPLTLTSDGTRRVITGYAGGGGITANLSGALLTVNDLTFTTFNTTPILTTTNGTDLTITNSKFTLGTKGAVATTGAALTITGSVFDQNGSDQPPSGGVLAQALQTLAVANSTFTANQGSFGAALTFVGTGTQPATVTNSYFGNNTSQYLGAAISEGLYAAVPVEISNSTFAGNSAHAGGAVFVFGTTSVTNSTFSGNTANQGGGAIAAKELTLSFSTLSGNSSTTAKGGNALYVPYGATITNSIITGSASSYDIFGTPVTASHSSLRQGNLWTGSAVAPLTTNGVNGNQVGQDPQLGALGDNGGFLIAGSTTAHIPTMLPAATSPVVNAATYSAGTDPATDERGTGFARSSGPAADMGAVERQSKSRVPLTVSAASTSTHPVPGTPIRLVRKISTPGRYTVSVRCANVGITTAGDMRPCKWTRNASTGAITVTTRRGHKVAVRITIVSFPTPAYPSSRYVPSTWTRTWTSR